MSLTPPRRVQRVAAYALLRDGAGITALVRGSSRSDLPGRWGLPGGGVEHGEHPEQTVVRETDGLPVTPLVRNMLQSHGGAGRTSPPPSVS